MDEELINQFKFIVLQPSSVRYDISNQQKMLRSMENSSTFQTDNCPLSLLNSHSTIIPSKFFHIFCRFHSNLSYTKNLDILK